NLDPASGRAAIELIDDLHRDHSRTILLVEHRLEDVLHRDVDRIVLMDGGRIVADAPPAQLLASGLLERHGIRPPLHVAALRYAGAPVRAEQRPARSADMDLDEDQIAAVRRWVRDGGDAAAAAADGAGGADGVGERAPALELEQLRCEIPVGPERSTLALAEVSARIARGEMLGVLGSNGAGKSTLARVICGFERATGGRLRIGGVDAHGWSLTERGERVGFVLQEPGQMISQPQVTEEIALGLRARGLGREESEGRTAAVLEICGLRPFRSWPVSALSHGQRKRVTIASVLALEPEVLILDEPTAGQD